MTPRFLSLATAVVVTAALLSPAGPRNANAQSNLFDKAKDLLGTVGTSGGAESGGSALSNDQIAGGLREALRVGTERVVGQVGAVDGFNADPSIHIPLPGVLKDVQSMLQTVGMGSLGEDLELKLNRAAEVAAPEAKALFWNAISEMTLEDVQTIYNGPDDSATRYFQGKMSSPLAERMAPIVNDSLSEVGAIKSYDDMIGQYKSIPLVPDAKADLTSYVVEKALDGIFHYVAKEEAAIRNNPAARTTEILQDVFGSS